MPTSYPQQPNAAAQPVYPYHQPVYAPDGTYYRTAPDGRQIYVHDPYGAVSNRALVPATTQSAIASWFDYTNASYIKGVLIGAGATLLVTNPKVQSAIVNGAVAAWAAVVGGIEEIKERVRDAKAEKSQG
jgi:hypothetical protein